MGPARFHCATLLTYQNGKNVINFKQKILQKIWNQSLVNWTLYFSFSLWKLFMHGCKNLSFISLCVNNAIFKIQRLDLPLKRTRKWISKSYMKYILIYSLNSPNSFHSKDGLGSWQQKRLTFVKNSNLWGGHSNPFTRDQVTST